MNGLKRTTPGPVKIVYWDIKTRRSREGSNQGYMGYGAGDSGWVQII